MAQHIQEKMVKKLNKLKSFALTGLLIASCTLCRSQTNTAITVKINGYFIILGQNIFVFQPTEDSTHFFQSLDNTSFGLGTNNGQSINGLLENSIQGLGDCLHLVIRQNSDGSTYEDSCRYFYCEMECSLSLWDNDLILNEKPARSLFYNNIWYNVDFNFIRNRTLKIIPKKKKDIERYRKNYISYTGRAPQW